MALHALNPSVPLNLHHLTHCSLIDFSHRQSVSPGCCDKVPQTDRQKFLTVPEAGSQDASLAGSDESSLLGLHTALSSHGGGGGEVSKCSRLFSYKDTNVTSRAPLQDLITHQGLRVLAPDSGRAQASIPLPPSPFLFLHNSSQGLCCLLWPTTNFGLNISI